MRSTRTPPADDRFPGFADLTEPGESPDAGHGTDYRARELGTNRVVLLRRVAPSDGPADSDLATLAAVSAHPNVVTLYRSFRAPDGSTVLVLEPARGALAERVAGEGALPPPDAVAIAVAIAGALETAHRAGVLHGAVSPRTVLVSRFGPPVLGGLGLTAGPSAIPDLDPHAAPEVLEGGPISPATDVYGLAATLYHLVAGRAPFDVGRPESAAAQTLRILRDPPAPLDPARIPMMLSDALQRALAKEPADRPGSAVALAGELAAVERAQGWPVTPLVVGEAAAPRRRPAPGPVTSTGSPRRPRPMLVTAAGAVPVNAVPPPARAHPTSTTPG